LLKRHLFYKFFSFAKAVDIIWCRQY